MTGLGIVKNPNELKQFRDCECVVSGVNEWFNALDAGDE